MRALVRLEEEDRAKTLGDALFAEGIDNRVETSREGGYLVWVHDELQMDAAKKVLAAYEENPDDPRFERARRVASAKRREKEAEAKKTRHRQVDVRQRWRSQSGVGRLSIVLIIASVAVTALAGTLLDEQAENTRVTQHVFLLWGRTFGDFELWRLITPIFLHFGPIHLGFNGYMLYQFGGLVERRHSSWMLALMVLVIGALSNVAQAYLVIGTFGGMSGVIYGLFGYFWIRGRMDPGFGIALPRSTVIILLGWMALGFFGFFRMANIAHLGGLVVGMAWGAIAALRARRPR